MRELRQDSIRTVARVAAVPETETERAYAAVLDLILSGDLRIGERTSVNLLSSRLEIGRTPIKEAVIKLRTEGLLSVSERSGTTVKRLSADEIKHLYDVRHMFEDFIAEPAATLITKNELERILSLIKVMKQYTAGKLPGATAEFVRANAAFHSAIVAAAHNPFASRLYDQLQIQLQIVSYLLNRRHDHAAALRRQAEHEAIAQALRDRDGKTLKRLMRSHTKEPERVVIESLASSPPRS